MPRPRLTPEEREARRRERNRRGFTNATFKQYDPTDEIGYGNARQWRAAAGAAVHGDGFTMEPPKPRHRSQLGADLAQFGLAELPPTIRELHLAYRRLAMTKHPNGHGTHQGFIAFQEAYDRLKARFD